MSSEPDGVENLRRKLDLALKQIRRNISAFSPDDLEAMVRYRLIDARAVPSELRTDFVRRRLGLRK
jgi:hypothetical protein